MKIAILTFQGFNELDSFIASGLLNRMQPHGWEAFITSPSEQVCSMNGVTIRAQQPLEFANQADAVLFGSGVMTRDIANDEELLGRLQLNPARQLIGAQCSGTLLMAKLGLIDKLPACTDQRSKPWVEQAGIEVLDAPFYAAGKLATAGGCLSAQYLASWVMLKLGGEQATREALAQEVPVGEKDSYIDKLLQTVQPFIS